MSNRYANLVGSNKIKDEYTKINTGFDKVEEEIDAHVGAGGNAHATATTSSAGFMAAADKQKLDGIEDGAQVNQNAYAKVNGMEADDPSDEVTFEGGTGITVTQNPNEKKVTITATGEATPGPHGSAHLEFGSDPIPYATVTDGGLMSAEDKQSLEALEGLPQEFTELKAETVTGWVNVKWHGAVGDGVTDDTESIRSALAIAKATGRVLFFPPGTYLISGQLDIDGFVVIQGSRIVDRGTIIKTTSDAPILHVTSKCRIQGIAFQGSSNEEFTQQDGILIDNINDVLIEDCFFANLYNGIHINETVFYSVIRHCYFYSAINALIYGNGTSSSGYQVQINDCVAAVNSTKYGFYFGNVGGITISDLEMSPTNCTDSAITFASFAQNAGVSQITHSRIEGSSVNGINLIGTESKPIRYLFVSNTYILGAPAVKAQYAKDIFFDNCYFTGANKGYVAEFVSDNISFVNCDFQVNGTVLSAESTVTSISCDFVNPIYTGAYQFVYLPNLSIDKVNRVTVTGGSIGTNAKPIDLASFPRNKVKVLVPGYTATHNYGTDIQSGTASTTYTIAHGLIRTPTFVSVIPGSGAVGDAEIKAVTWDETNITVELKSAPTVGTNNLTFVWEARI